MINAESGGELPPQKARETGTGPAPAFRFNTKHLIYLTTVIAVGCYLQPWLLIWASVWILACYFCSKYERKTKRWSSLALTFLFLLIPLCCGTPLMFGQPEPAFVRTLCINKQRQLVLGMIDYESAWMKFPAASEFAADGTPMHSWRVRILPYIGEQKLYDQYDFDEPWNGPNNIKLVEKMPDAFWCPGRDHGLGKTHYKTIVGPRSDIFPRKLYYLRRYVPSVRRMRS